MSEETDSTRFIDPYSDFGFKHIFGKAPNKSFLISFLNQLLKGRKVVIDIQYNNTEYKGSGNDYRKTVFDLYCTGDKGEKFIVEMQKAKVKNFKDRSIFYTANLIQEQGVGVIADWNYQIPEIYFVAIMNFKFDDSHPDHFIHDVRLMEINTNQEFYPKLAYIFIEMPKFKKLEEELENELEEWLYILNNLKELSEIPLSLIGKGEYDKVFEIAEVGNLTPEEMNEYQQRLKIRRDNYSAMEYIKEEALERGIEIGHEKGLEKGRVEERKEMAFKLKAGNISLSFIAETTGLSIEEIGSL
ncbi:MAG: Rpn family recombination-promoting nuclease/putative transposase [Candidatus Pedobacter colombiensis]|uniref:Rpn family recombination-promoting nuclease/putative transposase n=1 Tax=Candidatus Pedobacter colombiensis TaxID=3121371 RepID=A0AAJ6B566_9SPHI|nr:Rpn family recombination-promoting nuclease/putative transposase [Pedobacter sp.]WEK17464.1 MAG: Rpn family recombination-promoting nuclease/putative transposase [Pedobacter sp.]